MNGNMNVSIRKVAAYETFRRIPIELSITVYFNVKMEQYVNSSDVCIIVLKTGFQRNFFYNFACKSPAHLNFFLNGPKMAIKQMLQVAKMIQRNTDPMPLETKIDSKPRSSSPALKCSAFPCVSYK